MTRTAPLEIQDMEEADLDQVVALERSAFPSPWSREAFLHELHSNPFARTFVVRDEGGLAAYACIWLLEGELLINNIMVAPEHQGRGLGRRLLDHLLATGRQAGCRSAVLEVRPSNERALRLYHAAGFRTIGQRAHYYSDGEDALILGRPLVAGEPPPGP